jgi:hypothetical protein
MKLSVVRRILREDLPGQLPQWIEPFLTTLNQFIDEVTLALRGNLTFEDNFSAKLIQIRLTHAVETEINPLTPKKRVRGILPVDTGGQTLTGWSVRRKENGNIGVTVLFSTTTSADVQLYILFEG